MNRLPIVCSCCQKSLTGGLDTFGDVDCPMCWDCHSTLLFNEGDGSILSMWAGLQELMTSEFPESSDDEVYVVDEDDEELTANGGLVESRGMWFCFACGLLAQPGDEEFDWCDHINGVGCAYMHETEDDEFEDERD